VTRLKLQRPSPALVVALVALVAASSGTSYAVTKGAVKATSVDGVSAVRASATRRAAAGRLVATVKRGRDRGRFAARFIPVVARAERAGTADRAETAGTAANAADAAKLGGRSVAQLRAACGPGTVDAGSLCIETGTRAPATPLAAFKTCSQAGGSVPQAADLLGASQAGRITLAAEEWSATILDTGPTPYLTVNSFGPASAFGPANTQPYRCAFVPREAP
jgi:hypothetical protein